MLKTKSEVLDLKNPEISARFLTKFHQVLEFTEYPNFVCNVRATAAHCPAEHVEERRIILIGKPLLFISISETKMIENYVFIKKILF